MTATPRFDAFVLLCRAHGLPEPELEFQFHPTRRWRSDYAWPAEKVLVEKEGGLFAGGRRPGLRLGGHSSLTGVLRDMDKANAAAVLGYCYLRFTPAALENGSALPMIQIALARHVEGGPRS
jgi:hypothetical protein